MSVDSTISMALTLHGDATVESRSNAVASSIRNMGSSYRDYAKHARHSRYAMAGVNFLTGGMLGQMTRRLTGEMRGAQSSLGKTLEELGMLIGGGMGYSAVSRIQQMITVGSRQASDTARNAVASRVAASKAATATTAAVGGFMAGAVGFLVASAGAVVIGMAAAWLLGKAGDIIADNWRKARKGDDITIQPGGARISAKGRRQFLEFQEEQLRIGKESVRTKDRDDLLPGSLADYLHRWLEPYNEQSRFEHARQQVSEQILELWEQIRAGEEQTRREQQALFQSMKRLGRL